MRGFVRKSPVWFNEMFSAGFFSMVLALASKSSWHFPTSGQLGHMFSDIKTLYTPSFEALKSKTQGEDKAKIVYPLVICFIANWKITTFHGRIPAISTGPCSIASKISYGFPMVYDILEKNNWRFYSRNGHTMAHDTILPRTRCPAEVQFGPGHRDTKWDKQPQDIT